MTKLRLYIALNSNDKKQWRICLSDVATDDWPFIAPWKCSGTMKYVHTEWLKSWLDSNKRIKQNQYHTITLYNAVSWELCKENFPIKVKCNGKIIDILTYK